MTSQIRDQLKIFKKEKIQVDKKIIEIVETLVKLFKQHKWRVLGVDIYPHDKSFSLTVYKEFIGATYNIHCSFADKYILINFAKGKSSTFYGANSLTYKLPQNVTDFITDKVLRGKFMLDMITKQHPSFIREEYRKDIKTKLKKQLVG